MTTKGLPFVSLLTEICGYILFVSVLAVIYGNVEEAERHCHGNTPLSQPVKPSPILQQVMRFWSTKKKYQFKQFLCLGWWEFVHLLRFLLPLLFKILWEFNHQFHHSLEMFNSAPYYCRPKKGYKFLPSIIGTWHFTIRVSIFMAPHNQ